MNPVHHPPDEYLLEYAAGSLGEGESLLMATHASLCAVCKRRIRELENLAGVLLEKAPVSDVSSDLLARTLAKLPVRDEPCRAPPPASDAVLPRPLLHYTGPLERISWKKAFQSVWYVDLPVAVGAVPVRLRRFEPGVRIPAHTHRGAEFELILSGGALDDRDGRKFERGDVAYNDEHDTHSVTIDNDEPCIALGVHTSRVKPLGLWSRLVFGYLGW